MNVAIVGAGLIGKKRAASLKKNDRLLIICDINEIIAKKSAHEFSTNYTDNVKDIINNSNIDIVIISVINKYAAQITTDMLLSGKSVLCEKPLGRNVKESQAILSAAEKSGKIVKTGFNHRFHPAIIKAKELLGQQAIGTILNIRSRYGHGGRPGMEQEWRCSKELCGGGELLDQGVHIIDLCRWFTAVEIAQVYGKTFTSFWKIDVEDNAFFSLEFNDGVLAQCHVSWTNWKNIFSFEIFGDNGLHYHIERLKFDDALLVSEVSQLLVVRGFTQPALILLGILAAIMLLLSALLAYFFSKRALKPLTELSELLNSCDPERLPKGFAAPFANNELGAFANSLEKALNEVSEFVERELQFTRDASHELRTPITSILGACELLQADKQLTPQQRGVFMRINHAAENMQKTVESLLLVARGETQLTKQPVLIEPFIEQSILNYAEQISEKQLEIECEIEPGSTLNADS